MMIAQIEKLIRYITNAEGEATDVIVPLEIWQELINFSSTDKISGLAWIDEQEPKEKILADLQESIKLGEIGQTFSVSQLWTDTKA
jgi:inorganic pyrophosphatase